MIDKARRIIRKYIEYITTKVRLLWEQKVFIHDGVRLKYILKKNADSNVLVVVFSACTRKGLKARYNYVKTLNGLKCNKLYILDDFGADHRGSYYMGYHFDFKEESATKALIQEIADELQLAKLIFCGSSKGGYAALNFGSMFQDSVMVVGAPQYYLTSYLIDSGNLDSLNHIMGERTLEKEEKLQYYLRDKLSSNPYIASQLIYMHFSDKEHTYEEHIRYLLEDLEQYGYRVEKDVADYQNHSDISFYFPDFLRAHISRLIEEVV